MTTDEEVIALGWSAADVDPSELVDDDWIAKNTRPAKKPSKVRSAAAQLRNRLALQQGSLTRDQMRRIAQRTGYPVKEAWSAHNKGSMKGVWGAMIHHTGTPWSAAGDYPTLRVVRDGRPGLENSLSAFGLGKSGTIYLISEKLSWHAGAGAWNGMTDGNGYTVGIEAESDGVNWTAEERDAYPRLVASILLEIGEGDKYTTRHGSYALPAGRKTDAGGLNMDDFWAKVYDYLANPEKINKNYRPAPAITGAILTAYNRFGPGRLGAPVSAEVPTGDGVGRWQNFERGAIYWHPKVDNGVAHVIIGDILRLWRELGFEWGAGWPVSDEMPTPDGRGAYSHFTNGSIYSSVNTPTSFMGTAIRDKWAAQGWETGPLGYPITNQTAINDGRGHFVHFQNGSIYWTAETGARIISGPIRDKWGKLGWERGPGYPTTDVSNTPDGFGSYVHFDRDASIYWSPETGACVVYGPIREKWKQLGWETNYGYPEIDVSATPDKKGLYAHFTGLRSIYWTEETGAQPVYGVIRQKWAEQGWENGEWGYPTSGQEAVSGVLTQAFQGGRVTVQNDAVNFTPLGTASQE